MKGSYRALFFIGILILVGLHLFLFSSVKEGFDDAASYDTLRNRLQKELGPYCKISTFVREQVGEMQKGVGGTSSDISKMYADVYACKDTLARSRPSCSSPNKTGMRFVPCSVYLELPDWSDDNTVTSATSKITDELPERLLREIEWFAAVIKKLQEGLDAGANPVAGSNPPGVAPTAAQISAMSEGFSSCSPEASAYIRRKEIIDEAASCSPRTPKSEIARINRLLDDPSVSNSVSKCNVMLTKMLKLQSDLEKLKNGTLYDWQKDGPKKSYKKFEGGDRTAALKFSMQQNQ